MTSRSNSKIAGEAIAASLEARGLSQYEAARFTGTSQPLLNQIVNGRRLPSPEWLNIMATTLEMTVEERAKLHRAAAKAHGYEIDLI